MRRNIIWITIIIVLTIVNSTLAFPVNESKEFSTSNEEKKIPEFQKFPNFPHFPNNGIPPFLNVDFKSDSGDKENNKSKSNSDSDKLDNIKVTIEKGIYI